jgi:hypothetical protein
MSLQQKQGEQSLVAQFSDRTTRDALPAAAGPSLPGEDAFGAPLTKQAGSDRFKYDVLKKLRVMRGQDPGDPETESAARKAETEKIIGDAGAAPQLRKLQLDQGAAQIGASKAQASHANAETAKTKRETEILGQPKPADLAKVAEGEDGMRKEFTSLNKSYSDVVSALERVKASAENPSAAGDMSLIFAYMKMLDPASTVREGEQAQAEQARGVPASLVATYNKALAGTKLDDAQRKDFTDRAAKLFDRENMLYENRAQQFTEIAQERGYNAKNIVLKFAPGAGAGATKIGRFQVEVAH